MTQSWLDRYNATSEWHQKCLVMALYHSTMKMNLKGWVLSDTAEYFNVSIGLVSENIKLSNAIDEDITLTKCKTRQDALDRLKRY